MKPRALLLRSSLLAILFIAVFQVVANWGGEPGLVRGKSAALQLDDGIRPEQRLAESLALSDARVQRHTVGKRSEVFGVSEILADQYTEASQACATADCFQVEIYIFDENAAVTAIVDVEQRRVLDVLYQPGMQPGINKRLADEAVAIAVNAPEVIDALGYRPDTEGLAPVPAQMLGTSCEADHLCAAPTFQQGDRILWAVVDLTEGRLAGTGWTDIGPDVEGGTIPSAPAGCPAPGLVSQDGWSMAYETTGTDGLRVYNVTYNGTPVLTSAKLIQWHADYGSWGYQDSTGCGGGGGGFPIYPYGETQIVPLMDSVRLEPIGFEVVQDFRMGNWGGSCNYRYEQRIQFYNDGRFRVASAAYGKGCGTNSLYRPVVRIDLAVEGEGQDTFSYWDGTDWTTVMTETYRVPTNDPGHGPHLTTDEGYAWRVDDDNGAGYYVILDEGQYPMSRGSIPFVYFTKHHEDEGDTDLGVIGTCCRNDYQQGPDQYVDGEQIESEDLVLWHVGQMDTDANGPDYYCWTVTGEPNPETYPCVTGPMFVPIPTDPPPPTELFNFLPFIGRP